jgi:hypothetical protein
MSEAPHCPDACYARGCYGNHEAREDLVERLRLRLALFEPNLVTHLR